MENAIPDLEANLLWPGLDHVTPVEELLDQTPKQTTTEKLIALCALSMAIMKGMVSGTLTGAFTGALLGYTFSSLRAETSSPCKDEGQDPDIQRCAWLHSPQMHDGLVYGAIVGAGWGLVSGGLFAARNYKKGQEVTLGDGALTGCLPIGLIVYGLSRSTPSP